jgi:DNA-binding NarL/FixJ family response regulator
MVEAFRLASAGTRDEIERHAGQSSRPARAFLKAVLRQYDGDVDGAMRALRHQLTALRGLDRAVVADTLAPILVMRHDVGSIDHLADIVAAAGWRSSAFALRALAAAELGRGDDVARLVAAARAALLEEDDEVVRARVLQRLARTSYLARNYEQALDLAAASAALCLRLGAWRVAAASYSIAYNVHYCVTGQMSQASRFAKLCYAAALKSRDASFIHPALVAEYDFAVQFADDCRIEALEREIESHLLPQQYTERFSYVASRAIAHGPEDLVAMRTVLHVLRETPARSRGQSSLCSSLIAIADASLYQDESARANVHAAISRLGRPVGRDPGYEQAYRKLARATTAAACVLIGADVHAERVVSVQEVAEDEDIRRIPKLMQRQRWDDFAPSLRGIGRVYAAAWKSRVSHALPAGLTPAEFEVLRLLDRGWSAGKIADATERSVNTVYSHTRAIREKLEASRASEAVAIARDRGYLS